MSTDDKDKRRSLSNIIIFKVLPASGLVYLPIRKTSFGKMIGSRIEKTKASLLVNKISNKCIDFSGLKNFVDLKNSISIVSFSLYGGGVIYNKISDYEENKTALEKTIAALKKKQETVFQEVLAEEEKLKKEKVALEKKLAVLKQEQTKKRIQ